MRRALLVLLAAAIGLAGPAAAELDQVTTPAGRDAFKVDGSWTIYRERGDNT